jgi:hypothetical protein
VKLFKRGEMSATFDSQCFKRHLRAPATAQGSGATPRAGDGEADGRVDCPALTRVGHQWNTLPVCARSRGNLNGS